MTPPAPTSEIDIAAEFDAQLIASRDHFEQSIDGTLGIEEEFAICVPESLDLDSRFDDLDAAAREVGLDKAVAGELLASEIEFRTGRCEQWADAVAELTDIRRRVAAMAQSQGAVLGASATHPWADYREQSIVPLPYYEQLVDRMQLVARRNNTFGLHVHVGVQGADRAIKVHDALRSLAPMMLALSGSSPFLDGIDSGLVSARSIIFSRGFPRANVAPVFGTLDGYLDHLRWLRDSGSISTVGQVWWGTRPHVLHGTIELRVFDGQPDVRDTLALAALACGTVAHLCDLHDAGELPEPHRTHMIDENCWRASRYGTEAEFLVLPGTTAVPASEVVGEMIANARAASARRELGLDSGLDRVDKMLTNGSSAQWQRALYLEAGELMTPYRAVVDTTMTSADAEGFST